MTKTSHQENTRSVIKGSIEVKQRVLDTMVDQIVVVGHLLADCIAQGGKIIFCGNGGSASDAQHLAAELLVRLRPNVNRQSLASLTLATDMSTVTACGNDYGFDEIYARALEGLGQKGDILIGITTSGNSQNIINALKQARTMDISTIGLLGKDGGPALEHCDTALVVPSSETGRIQESHIMIGHILIEIIEDVMTERGQLQTKK